MGTGFPSEISDVQFVIDGVNQTVTSSSSSQITLTISGMVDSFSNNTQFYLPSGTPAGLSKLNKEGINLTNSITVLSISPSIGSTAGSIITAVVKGVGVKTTGVSFVVQGSSTNICS